MAPRNPATAEMAKTRAVKVSAVMGWRIGCDAPSSIATWFEASAEAKMQTVTIYRRQSCSGVLRQVLAVSGSETEHRFVCTRQAISVARRIRRSESGVARHW